MEAKGKTVAPAAWKKRDWSWWAPGTVVAWTEVEPDGRLDLYVSGESVLLGDELLLREPDCDCAEVQVVFLDPTRRIGSAASSVRSRSRSPSASGNPCRNSGRARPRSSSSMLGERFLRRNGVERLAARHHRVRHEVGVAIYAKMPGAMRAPMAAVGARRARPNEPCPCGSGKKFKKCCGSAAR